ncbi:GATA type transcriptional activator of nitrogen-regulated proteins, partial [Massospora cicadina]
MTRTNFGKTICFDCGTDTTSLWRRDGLGNTVCNACRLYFLHHNKKRPFSTRPHVIKRRNRKKQPKPKAKPKTQADWGQLEWTQLPPFESLTRQSLVLPARPTPLSDLAQYHYSATPRHSASIPPFDIRSDSTAINDFSAPHSSPPRCSALPSLRECIRSLGVISRAPHLRPYPSVCPTTPPPSPRLL